MYYGRWHPRVILNTPGRVWQIRQWLWRQNRERCSTGTTVKIGSGFCLWSSQKCHVQLNRRKNAEFSFKIWNFIIKRKMVCFKANEHNIVFQKCWLNVLTNVACLKNTYCKVFDYSPYFSPSLYGNLGFFISRTLSLSRTNYLIPWEFMIVRESAVFLCFACLPLKSSNQCYSSQTEIFWMNSCLCSWSCYCLS